MFRRFSPLVDVGWANLEAYAASGAEIPVHRNVASPNPQVRWRIEGSPDDDAFVLSNFLAFLLELRIYGHSITSSLLMFGITIACFGSPDPSGSAIHVFSISGAILPQALGFFYLDEVGTRYSDAEDDGQHQEDP